MTKAEIEILDHLGDAWALFSNLPEMHSSHKTDFVNGIHVLQRLILAREGLRSLQRNETSRIKSESGL